MRAEEVADRVLAALDRGLVYDGKPVDRAWFLETIERAAGISEAQFDEYCRDALRDFNPELKEAELDHLVGMREEVRLALLRRLRS